MSASDALLFMLASSFSQDVYKRFINRPASDAQVVNAARIAAIVGGVLAAVIAIKVAKSVIDALGIFYTLVGVSLFVPVVAGLYTRTGGAIAALCSIGGGVALAAGVQLVNNGGGFYHGLTPALWGLLAAILSYSTAAALIPASSRLH